MMMLMKLMTTKFEVQECVWQQANDQMETG